MNFWLIDWLNVQEELTSARAFLRREMGLGLGSGTSNIPINFTKDEINMYVKRFKSLDRDNKGYISVNDLRRYFKVCVHRSIGGCLIIGPIQIQ